MKAKRQSDGWEPCAAGNRRAFASHGIRHGPRLLSRRSKSQAMPFADPRIWGMSQTVPNGEGICGKPG
jgi:hypothetical protein